MLINLLISWSVAVVITLSYLPDGVAAEMGYTPQISNELEIKVTVALQDTSNKVNTWNFEVTLETHSRTLADDMTKSSVLMVDGKQYQPSEWEGAPPEGHHRKGLLRFKVIVPPPRAVELQIRLAGDPTPRVFKWLLK